MLTYMFCLMFKEVILDHALKGDTLDKAMGIVALPLFVIVIPALIFGDILFIPIYLLIGIVYLLLKLISIFN